MPERIAMRYTVALQGFSEFERGALASSFRLAQQRAPAYDQAPVAAESDFIIADADHPADVAAIREADRLQDTIFIGARPPAGAAAWLPRPIEPTRIVRELDLLLEQRLALLDEPPQTDWVASRPDALLGDSGGPPAKDVLVVDDSRIALKFLQTRLQGLGYRVHTARSAAEAMSLVDAQSFSLAFLDIGLGEGKLDGLAVCQHIKRRHAHPGGVAPGVMIVTGSGSSTNRVRSDLAGCDAYLTKPLLEDEFMAALRRLDPALEPAHGSAGA